MADDGSLAEAISSWAEGRPWWERTALGMLARNEPIDSQVIERLADEAESQATGRPFPGRPVTLDELGRARDGVSAVTILGIQEPRSVNALEWDEGISFEPNGLTLIYGQNGSGKSGYARVLKTVTRARQEIQVLGNIFVAEAPQSALLSVKVGSKDYHLRWPTDAPEFLQQVSFYDSGCAERYVAAETEVAYRPWSITLLDKLVSISALVRKTLESRQSAARAEPLEVPGVLPNTRAGHFVQSVSATTTQLDLDVAKELPSDSADRLASLQDRIEVLRSSNHDATRARLRLTTDSIATVKAALASATAELASERVAAVRSAAAKAAATRTAATQASELRFHGEPVTGIGDAAWMVLWDAARRFSEQSAYPGRSFPHVHDGDEPARCVLCQQELDDDARDRLVRFEEFVSDESEAAASEAKAHLDRLTAEIERSRTDSTQIALAIQRLETEEAAATQVRQAIEELDRRRDCVLAGLAGGAWPQGDDLQLDLMELDLLEARVQGQMNDLLTEDPEAQAESLVAEEREIRSRLALREGEEAVLRHIEALRRRHLLDESIRLTNTQGITRRAAELTRSHVSDVMKHRFSQETLTLGLGRVRLGDAGGGQGNLRHRAQFVDAVRNASLDAVLSEGEQTALGLAGFLTEVESDLSKSAVVFDDPVTSLDHVRQEKVAQRLVLLAATRQVIVFTHDIGFVVDVKRAAETHDIQVSERHVSSYRNVPGRVLPSSPWDAKTVGQRITTLEERIANLRSPTGDLASQHAEVRHWYQDLRTVWERCLEEAVIEKVTSRSRLEVRPLGLEALVHLTQEDNREFQDAFTRCGDRGSHATSTQLNRPIPPIEELREDLDLLRRWHKRVKGYK